MDKKQQPIVQGHDVKKGVITYQMQDGRLKLPEYKKLHIDGQKVRLELIDGTIKHLPDLYKGYKLKDANKWQIIFTKQ